MAGTHGKREMIAEGPAVILVHPQLGENIGMVARAMANFGLAELRLVNPRDGWPSEKARSAASKADHVIDGAKLYTSTEEAIADLNFVYATTARDRDGFKPVRGPATASATLRTRFAAGEKTGILFGREKSGLTNEEVALADEIVTFPVNPAFASLNIAQAVLLMSYEWMKSGMEGDEALPFQAVEQQPATKADLQGLFDHVEEALDARGYFRPADKKPKLIENLRTVFTRPSFTASEISVLRGVISSLDRFTRDNPRGAGSPNRAKKPNLRPRGPDGHIKE
ncbi:RNA methyltransferase [Rhizobium sp. L1K21]|uniref:RNA methyltransferase n=1 Tax=Rhizobium sp. L1K21 TaxID=2954933 RepID=UPI0020926E3F|nr:RNA methyltransferase [Rhizobium sp. L1K21]MCO6186354.1 RNA methyltransferase [Rhizobium sp. L1K21]